VNNKDLLKLKQLQAFDKAVVDNSDIVVAGVDEAGRGPLAGPVVAAAVVIKNYDDKLSGVNDSKKLSPLKRRKLFEYITQEEDILVGVGIVSSEVIDKINILQATHVAMRQAIGALNEQFNLLLIDGLFLPDINFSQQKVIKGDALSLSIATASIVAKVTRDALMDEYDRQYPGYGFSQHKGYGTRAHMESIKKLGPSKIHRRSFSPVKEMVEELKLNI